MFEVILRFFKLTIVHVGLLGTLKVLKNYPITF